MKIDVHGLILTKIHSPRATCQHSNLTLTCLGAGEAMAGFPCWEPLEKQFSVATELGPDHIGNDDSGELLIILLYAHCRLPDCC